MVFFVRKKFVKNMVTLDPNVSISELVTEIRYSTTRYSTTQIDGGGHFEIQDGGRT